MLPGRPTGALGGYVEQVGGTTRSVLKGAAGAAVNGAATAPLRWAGVSSPTIPTLVNHGVRAIAGFLLLFDSPAALQASMRRGVYGTILPVPEKATSGYSWTSGGRGALADMACAQPGDSVFFFHDRTIHGWAELEDVRGSAVWWNYRGAHLDPPRSDRATDAPKLVAQGAEQADTRFVAFFTAADDGYQPVGVDMDEVLESGSDRMRALRTMQNRSFIRFEGDEEAEFKKALVVASRLATRQNWRRDSPRFDVEAHAAATSWPVGQHQPFRASDFTSLRVATGRFTELDIETELVEALTDGRVDHVFAGPWTAVHRQVPASPAKPVAYVDRIDLLLERTDPRLTNATVELAVVEVKRDAFAPRDLAQLMRYVDWVANQRFAGDYSRIRAFAVAAGLSARAETGWAALTERTYTQNPRSPQSARWRDEARFISFNSQEGQLVFTDRTPGFRSSG